MDEQEKSKFPRVILIIIGIVVLISAVNLRKVSDMLGLDDRLGATDGPGATQDASQEPMEAASGKFKAPISDFSSRITKKSFGTYVEPGNSPVDPEKFTGFHSGIDLEIKLGEENIEVPVAAICDGELAIKRTAQGYGGVVAQYCDYQGQPVTVIYGHLSLSSVSFNQGDQIRVGDKIGILGQQGPDTDNERKHLHLGIRKGHSTVILGYVPDESSLSDFVNPNEALVQ